MEKTILFTLVFLACSSIFGQSLDEKYGEDVKSLDAIIAAYYEVISGSSTDPWEFERDQYIHSKNAVITGLDEKLNRILWKQNTSHWPYHQNQISTRKS